MNNVAFQEIQDNLLLVQCAFVSLVIARGDKLAIIDSGISELMPNALKPALKHLNAKLENVDLVINTHGHWDHIQGNPSIVAASDAEIWIPSAEMDKLPYVPDRALFDGDNIALGNSLNFEVISVPGHSVGMSCLYDRQHKILVASDAAQGYGGGGIPLLFHSPTVYRASIKRLMQLDIETLVLGHQFMWSGEAKFIQRGSDTIKQFLQESLDASMKVSTVIRQMVQENPHDSYKLIDHKTTAHLKNDSSYGFDPSNSHFRVGTILSELREMQNE